MLVCFVVDFLLPTRCRFTDVLCFFAHRKSVIFLLVFLFLKCFGGLSGSHLSFWSGSLSVSSDIVWFVRPELVVEVVVVSAEGRLKRHECSRFPVSLTRPSQLEMGISLVKLGRILSQTYFPTKGIPFSKSKFHLAVFSSVSFRFSLNKSSLICSWFTGPNNCRQTEWLGTMFGLSLRGQDGPKFICAAVISSCDRTTKSSTQLSHVEVRNFDLLLRGIKYGCCLRFRLF